MGFLAKCRPTPPPEPSTDCTDCADDCNESATATLVVSGFTGDCAVLNRTWVLERQPSPPAPECQWIDQVAVDIDARLTCEPGFSWRLQVIDESVEEAFALCEPCALVCSGDNPTGSGTLIGADACTGQTGNFTLT